MSTERTVTVRRLSTGSIFKIGTAGAFFSLVPFCLLMGVFVLLGYKSVSWSGQPIFGIQGLLMAPLIGVLFAALLAGLGGLAIAFGLRLFSKLRPLTLRLIEDVSADSKA
jgi:hypothetical protein